MYINKNSGIAEDQDFICNDPGIYFSALASFFCILAVSTWLSKYKSPYEVYP